jgi:hypothetical protein
MGGRVVVIKEPVVVVPMFWSFSLLNCVQEPQNVTVGVRVDRSVRRDKFTVSIPFHVQETMRMLFDELQTCRTFLDPGDCGLFHSTIVALPLHHNCKCNFDRQL